MELRTGDIVKHFKGKNLIEKNIYEIVSVNPEYTGTNEFLKEPVVVYTSIFQEGKCFVREYSDLVKELTPEQKEEYGQTYRIEPLTDEELGIIKTNAFILAKLEYIEKKYGKKEDNPPTKVK